jgi:hypothetical protein
MLYEYVPAGRQVGKIYPPLAENPLKYSLPPYMPGYSTEFL